MNGHGDARMRVTMLGPFEVCRGGDVVPVPGARLRGLLVRLALAGGRPVDPGTLVDALWPGDGPGDPANALQSLVSRLRRVLGAADTVGQSEGGYRLVMDAGDVDVLRFEQMAAAGRERLRAGDPGGAVALLGPAAVLWDGRAGTEPPAVAAVAPAVANRLARASAEAVADLAEAEIALGHTGSAIDRLTVLLAEQPVHERAAALLMDALAAQGREAEALALYERVRSDLADQLGADPGTALRERHLNLLHDSGPARRRTPASGFHATNGPMAGGSLPGESRVEGSSPVGRSQGDGSSRPGGLRGAEGSREDKPQVSGGPEVTGESRRAGGLWNSGGGEAAGGSPALNESRFPAEPRKMHGLQGDPLEPQDLGGSPTTGWPPSVSSAPNASWSQVADGPRDAGGPQGVGWLRDAGEMQGAGRLRDADGMQGSAGSNGTGRPRDASGLQGAGGAGGGQQEPPSNLPAPLTSFVGRDGDLARIESLLAGGRLVTVLGPGGAGKTRLAVEAARRHRHEYRDGTWLVDLASVTEAAKVGAAVLAAIGLRGAAIFENSAHRKWVEEDEIDLLADQLNRRESLLVVDNCEHLIDAVAHLLAALLPRCAGLRVLATSREPLAIDGEQLVPLGSLTMPEPGATDEQARRAASVRLFTERAASVRPGFDFEENTLSDILRVVRGLDGMPLALELAAARLRTLSLAELAAGLSDRFRLLGTGNRGAFPRHRTLRAVIAWSWDLLGEHERILVERVAVLPGGVTAAAAAAVCEGTGVPAADVPDLLAALVDKSLLQLAAEPGRHRMLETLREYGIERLASRDELGTVRDLAARYLSGLVARNEPELRGPGQFPALRVMRAEYDNVLAALRHLCDTGDADGAMTLALNLAWYWHMFGRHVEAAYWLGEALSQPYEGHTLRRDCAEAVMWLNRIISRPTRLEEATQEAKSELRLLTDRLLAYRALPGLAGALTMVTLFFLDEEEAALAAMQRVIDGPDRWLEGLARLFRAQFRENGGDVEQMRDDVEAAFECFQLVGDRWGIVTALPTRVLLRQYDGDLDGAYADLREAQELVSEFGTIGLGDEIFMDLRWIDLYVRRGEIDEAIRMLALTRERAARSSTPEMVILVDALAAQLWVRLGDLDQAEDLLVLAESGMSSDFPFGGDHGEAIVGSVRAALCVRRGDGPGAERALAPAYAAAVDSHDMPLLAMVAVTAAALADLYGRHEDTALLLGAAARLRGAHDPTDPGVSELSGNSRAALGEAAFVAAYGKGWEMDGKTALVRADPARLRLSS